MSKEVQDFFTSIAPQYDFLNHFLSLSIDKKWRDRALESLQGLEYGKILDLCAGTLDLTTKLTTLYPRSSVVALDFSLAMLENGQSKIVGNSQARCVCGDGHHMPFADASFDAIVCAFGIRNLENRNQALSEISRVLKPRGRLVVLEFFRPDSWFAKLFYETYGKYVIPRLGGLFSKNRKAYEYLQNSIQHFFSVSEYQKLLSENKFQVLQAKALSGGIAHHLVAEKTA